MPKSNGRPKDRQPKVQQAKAVSTCPCGGKATRFGVCVRCLDNPPNVLQLQAIGLYLPDRKQRRTGGACDAE